MSELETDTASKLTSHLEGTLEESDRLLGVPKMQPLEDDKRWLAYVAKLTVDDHQAAFLLPNELPGPRSDKQQVLAAMETALRRAYSHPQMRIEDYVLGKIQGRLRVLMPQGIEMTFHFENELGWKATMIISSANEERSFPAYYRHTCMNPLRRLALTGQFDSSEITFRPVEGEQVEQMMADPEVDNLTANALKRLYRQYQMLSGQAYGQ